MVFTLCWREPQQLSFNSDSNFDLPEVSLPNSRHNPTQSKSIVQQLQPSPTINQRSATSLVPRCHPLCTATHRHTSTHSSTFGSPSGESTAAGGTHSSSPTTSSHLDPFCSSSLISHWLRFPMKRVHIPLQDIVEVSSASDCDEVETDPTTVYLKAQERGNVDDLHSICSQMPEAVLDILFRASDSIDNTLECVLSGPHLDDI